MPAEWEPHQCCFHREVVGVPGATLSYGGGGPYCITQQMPLGRGVPAGAVSGR